MTDLKEGILLSDLDNGGLKVAPDVEIEIVDPFVFAVRYVAHAIMPGNTVTLEPLPISTPKIPLSVLKVVPYVYGENMAEVTEETRIPAAAAANYGVNEFELAEFRSLGKKRASSLVEVPKPKTLTIEEAWREYHRQIKAYEDSEMQGRWLRWQNAAKNIITLGISRSKQAGSDQDYPASLVNVLDVQFSYSERVIFANEEAVDQLVEGRTLL